MNILVTDNCAVMDVNLGKITSQELDFASEYKITISNNGHINGLVLWFDTMFSYGQRPIKLTTSNFEV